VAIDEAESGVDVGLFVELFVFPPNLMTNWPSLENPVVGVVNIVRTPCSLAASVHSPAASRTANSSAISRCSEAAL